MVNVDRRAFLQSATAAALTTSMPAAVQAEAPPATAKEKMIGIQVGAVSFFDEGADKVLDEFQRDAAVNTLFLAHLRMDGASPDGRSLGSLCPITASRSMTQAHSMAATTPPSIRST